MDKSEKDVRAFYATHTKEELLKEISNDENSQLKIVPRIKDVIHQKFVKHKVAILKDMILNQR